MMRIGDSQRRLKEEAGTATPACFIEVPMPIETSRLLIRPKKPGDGAASLAALAETWEDLQRWMEWAENLHEFTAETQEERILHQVRSFMLRKELNLLGMANGEPVIWCSFYDFDWTGCECKIGYWVRKSAQGKGFATETGNAMVRYAMGALGMRRVGLTFSSGNEASRRVAEKLGFTLERIERDASRLPGGRIADKQWCVRADLRGLPDLEVRWGSGLA